MLRASCAAWAAAVGLSAAPATALTIDFEQFDLGDGLAEVNAVTTPLGVTFLAAGNAEIVASGGGKGLQFEKTQGPIDRDAVINLGAQAAFIEVFFATSSAAGDAAIMLLYDQHKSTVGDDLVGFIVQNSRFGVGPLSIRPGDFFGPPFDVFLGVQLGQSITIGEPLFDFVIDDVEIEFALPEPAAAGLVAAGMLGLAARRQRGRTFQGR